MAILYGILIVINIVMGLSRKRSTAVLIVTYIFMAIIMAFNTFGPDVSVYRADYNSYGNYGETGYNFFKNLFNSVLCLDYYWFRLFMVLASLLILHFAISKVTANENFVVGIYLITLFFVDAVQIRNLVAEVIVLLAMYFLFSKKHFSTLKFLICIAIASLFHLVALFYFVLVIYKMKCKKALSVAIALLSVLFFVVFSISRESLINLVNSVTVIMGMHVSYSLSATKLGSFPIVIIYIADLAATLYFKSKLNKKIISPNDRAILDGVICVQLLLLPAIILLNLNTEYYRILRNIIVLKAIAFSILIKYFYKYDRNKFIISVCYVLLSAIITSIYHYIVLYTPKDLIGSLVWTLFNTNLIFDNVVDGTTYPIFIKITVTLLICVGIIPYISKRNRIKLKQKNMRKVALKRNSG